MGALAARRAPVPPKRGRSLRSSLADARAARGEKRSGLVGPRAFVWSVTFRMPNESIDSIESGRLALKWNRGTRFPEWN